MTNVACFCGCLYSFDGGAGACPRCGEYATVPTGSAVTCTEGGQPREQRVLAICQPLDLCSSRRYGPNFRIAPMVPSDPGYSAVAHTERVPGIQLMPVTALATRPSSAGTD
jgi:hypothetical protein